MSSPDVRMERAFLVPGSKLGLARYDDVAGLSFRRRDPASPLIPTMFWHYHLGLSFLPLEGVTRLVTASMAQRFKDVKRPRCRLTVNAPVEMPLFRDTNYLFCRRLPS